MGRLTSDKYAATQKAREILTSGKSKPQNKASRNVLAKKGYYLQKVIKPLAIRSSGGKHYIYCYLFGKQHNLMERFKKQGMYKALNAYNKRRNKLITSLRVPIGTKDKRFKEYLKKGSESLFLSLQADYQKNSVITEFNKTGICKVNVARLSNKWNHLYYLVQDDQFRLMKLLRKDSKIPTIKATISKEQAADLIEMLGLRAYGETWRRPQDVRFWAKYQKSKL
jgi:hypothetical protein